MLRRSALLLSVLAVVLLAAPPGAIAERTQPLLPLARGQLLVSLGAPPEWLPVSGRPLTVTLFAGRASARTPANANAYLVLQGANRGCGVSAAADGMRPIHEVLRLYTAAHLLADQRSPFAPTGGTAPGDYAAEIPGVVVRQTGATRVCVWLARSPRARGLVAQQDVPLLDSLFAASVSALPPAGRPAGRAYTLDAIDVGHPFRFSVATRACGTSSADAPQSVAPDTLATDEISYGETACPGDGSQFTFSSAAGSLGSLSYSALGAAATPPDVASLGGCELDPLTVVALGPARAYVDGVGCSVARLLVQPYQSGLPRGAVVAAQVDGGIAEVAPRGTAVDLVLNGRPG